MTGLSFDQYQIWSHRPGKDNFQKTSQEGRYALSAFLAYFLSTAMVFYAEFYMHTTLSLKKQSSNAASDAQDSPQIRPKYFEKHRKISSVFAKGSIAAFQFASGIRVYMHDYWTTDNFLSISEDFTPSFGFRFCISGNTELNLNCFKQNLTIKRGESSFFYFPSMEGSHVDLPNTHIQKVLILVKPAFLMSMMAGNEKELPNNLLAPLNNLNRIFDPYNISDIITPSMRQTLGQIFNCPYKGVARRVFIEGKAFELIATKLAQINPDKPNQKNNPALKSDDVERMIYAGEILAKDMLSPPSIFELAKMIGVSRTKLYHDFKQFYGLSPMEYLRLKRIEKAESLVKDNSLSMTQIAYSLGYSSSSHFAKAFKAHFGIPPSNYR